MRIEGSGAHRRRRRVGAGRGDGAARCTSAARRVTIADLNAEKGEALAGELGDGARFAPCDVREADQVEAAVRGAAEAAEGGLRITVCCAGVGWAEKTPAGAGPTSSSRSRPCSAST